ncbi:MAG: hypothetical protein R6W75_13660 [Smithellaceae bacterium]
MKNLTFALMFLFAASFAHAQTSPETYLAQLPGVPESACNIQLAQKATYEKTVRNLKDRMDKDIAQRKEETQMYVDANRDKIAAGLDAQPGAIPPKGGRLTREERKAKAEQMMRQQGVSPEDIKKISSMSKEEKTARALAFSSKAADPKIQEATAQTATIRDLLVEHKNLVEKIDTRKAVVLNKFKTLDQDAATTKAKEIDPLHRQLASMGGLVTSKEQSDRMDQFNMKLKDAQKRYCETYGPQYLALLGEYLAFIRESLPDYRRMEELVAKTQMGLDEPISASTGLYGIEALRDYTAMLTKVFKFDLPYEY